MCPLWRTSALSRPPARVEMGVLDWARKTSLRAFVSARASRVDKKWTIPVHSFGNEVPILAMGRDSEADAAFCNVDT